MQAAASTAWSVRWHGEALSEVERLVPGTERAALGNAVAKLAADGPRLAFPHSSAIAGGDRGGLRELRPRRGRCRWRLVYGRIGDEFAILALAPEAGTAPRGFRRAVRAATERHQALRRQT